METKSIEGLIRHADLSARRGERKTMETKKYVIFKKKFGYITSYFYNGTNVRTIAKILEIPYRNIYRYDYLTDLQKWQILNSDYCDYIEFDGTNKLLTLVDKETGKEKPLYFFKELEDLIADYERSLRQ